MDILLSETEQNLLMLLEELAKHQDWIQDSTLSENLNLLYFSWIIKLKMKFAKRLLNLIFLLL